MSNNTNQPTDYSPRAIRARYDLANLCAIAVCDRRVFASLKDILVLLKRVEALEKELAEFDCKLNPDGN